MREETGYTLIEMLAALMVISLAFVGLGQGTSLLARSQTRSMEILAGIEHESFIQTSLADAMSSLSDGEVVEGSERTLEMTCPSYVVCETTGRSKPGGSLLVERRAELGRLRLNAQTPFRFAYQTEDGTFPTWSRASRVRLEAVIVYDNRRPDRPVLVRRIYEQEPFQCAYDVISMRCFEATI